MHGTAWQQAAPVLPPLPGPTRAGVCVVGLGGTGLSAIERLLELGHSDVIGIDARGIAAGAAGRNGGFLLAGPAHFHHRAVAAWGRGIAASFYAHTVHAIERLGRAHPGIVDPIGSVRLAVDADEQRDLDAHADALRADGFPAERPTPDSLLIVSDAVFDPAARCLALAARARSAGVALHRAIATAVTDGRVATDCGDIEADAVLVCVDGRLDRLLPELTGQVHSIRLQMCATAPDPTVRARHAMYRRYGLDYWQQRPDGRLLVGGCRDLGGASEADTVDPSPTPVVQAGLDRILREVIGSPAAVTHRWAGIVGYTPDQLPLVRRLGPRVWAIGGYSGTGNIIGSELARGLASRIVGEASGQALLRIVETIGIPKPTDNGRAVD